MTKGKRRERQCADIYQDAGYRTYRPPENRYGVKDIFRHWDMVAVKPAHRPRFVQVKSNGAKGIKTVQQEIGDYFPLGWCVAEYAVCHDTEGWRLIVLTHDDKQVRVDERDSDCDMGAELTAYLS